MNIASIHAQFTRAGTFPYAAAKSGVLGLTRSLALETRGRPAAGRSTDRLVASYARRPGREWSPLDHAARNDEG